MSNTAFLKMLENQISVIFFQKDQNKNFESKNYNLQIDMSDNKNIENILGKFLPKFLIENDQNKNLNIEIVDLIIESPQIYEISTTVRKKFDKKPIQKKQVEYLIQDANEQILSSNKNLNIIHILVDNYYIDEKKFQTLQLDIVCDHLILDLRFICIPKDLTDVLIKIFKKYQIEIDSFICGKYLNRLIRSDDYDFFNACKKIKNGLNPKEVKVNKSKMTKMGIFERIFHSIS